MLFTTCTQPLLRELSAALRKISQKAVLSCSFASYCSGSVISKVTKSPVNTPWVQHGLMSAGVHQATVHPSVCNYKYQGIKEEKSNVQTEPEYFFTVKLISVCQQLAFSQIHYLLLKKIVKSAGNAQDLQWGPNDSPHKEVNQIKSM